MVNYLTKPMKKFMEYWDGQYEILEYNGTKKICTIKCNKHGNIVSGLYNTNVWKRNGYCLCPMCRIEKNMNKKLNKEGK